LDRRYSQTVLARPDQTRGNVRAGPQTKGSLKAGNPNQIWQSV
jgi:hypothetical protein